MNRALEILICITAGILTLPFLLFGCSVVLIVLDRPVLFSQMRAGRNGAPFRLYKLRTMSDARLPDGTLLPDAERETRATRLLRRLRLDEIPQLFLILRGQMALVGPRPLLPETVEGFGESGRIRGAVRPGLTGWSQVSGNTALTHEEKLQLDLWYVSHRSTALDLKILAETIGVAILGEHRRNDRLEDATNWLASEDVAIRGGEI